MFHFNKQVAQNLNFKRNLRHVCEARSIKFFEKVHNKTDGLRTRERWIQTYDTLKPKLTTDEKAAWLLANQIQFSINQFP